MNVCMLAYAHYINDARIKNYVRTLEDQGHRVDVIALRAEHESSVDVRPTGTTFRVMDKYQGQSTLKYCWSYLKFVLKSFLLLARRSFRNRYTVIHVHNMPNALVFVAFIPKILGAKVLLDVHDLMTVNYMAKFNVQETHPVVRVLKMEQRLSALFSDRVFCADHNQRDYLITHCGIRAEKVTVLMNLPNVELFKPVVKEKTNDMFRIVYHGTIAHRLGIDLILEAMAEVVDQIPAELWIYGAGDYLSEALSLSSRLGLQNKVHFSQRFFPVEEIPEMVCGMDLGIIGNRRSLACDRYMLPVKLLEYVYLDVPVVAPRLDVISRYFDETMVRFYDPENVEQMAKSILELYSDAEKRKRLTCSASTFYERHNCKEQAKRYLDLLSTKDSISVLNPTERLA